MKAPVRVAVTGAAGQIGYSPAVPHRLRRNARPRPAGDPAAARTADRQGAGGAASGVMMELEDCAFPLLAGMVGTADPKVAFKDADVALLVGAKPRGPGMERKDLLLENAKIFIEQGKALDAVASRNIKVLVVGNPANTNAYIAMKSAPSLPKKNFTAMLRLDHNRALSQLAAKSGKPVGDRSRSSSSGATTRRRCTPTTASPPSDGQSVKDADQRRELEPQRVPAHGRQARRGDHRGARAVVGGVGGQRRHRPRPRLDARQQRQMGHDGRAVGRQLRHSAGRHVRRAGHHGRRRVHARRATCRSTSSRASR